MTDKNFDLDPNGFIKDYQYYKIILCFPFKTIMRFQQKYGTNITDSLTLIKKEGGMRRFFSGMLPRYLREYFQYIGFVESFQYISVYSKEKGIEKPILFQLVAAILIGFGTVPFDSLCKFQQVYGTKEGRELLLHKAKLNGFTSYFHGFWASITASLLGSVLRIPALQNLTESENSEDPSKNEKSLLCLYSAFLTSDFLCNPLKTLALNKLVNIEPKTYQQISEQLFKEQSYQWMFRSMDTKLLYSFLRSSVVIYYLDYKRCKKQ